MNLFDGVCPQCGETYPGDCLHTPLAGVGMALFAEAMRDKGVCLNEDECLPHLAAAHATLAMVQQGAPLWLVGAGYTGDVRVVAAAVLAHPLYPRLKERSAREVAACDRPDTCRHGIVRRALLAVERAYFAALEDA